MCVGSLTPLPIELPLRAIVRTTSVVASPVIPEKHAQTRAPPIARRHPLVAVGELGDRHLQQEGADAGQGDEAEHGAEVEAERLLDLGQQDPERGAVELVDRVEPEQHDERERPLAAADLAEPGHRVAEALEEAAHGAGSRARSAHGAEFAARRSRGGRRVLEPSVGPR